MEKRNTFRQAWIFTLVLIIIWVLMPGFTGAGSLEPDSAPAPTMKTLDEIEPRIPIPGSSTVVPVYTISESGSYYLTGDRSCSEIGIQVDADNVTIDLMGYSLIGTGTGVVSGVRLNGSSNVEVRNGTITSFYRAIYATSVASKGHRIIDIRAFANIQMGIYLLSEGNLVKGCTVSRNGASAPSGTVYGINVGSDSLVTGNTVKGNGASASSVVYGIYTSNGSTLAGNVVAENGTGAGSTVYGIRSSSSSMVTDNLVHDNGSSTSGEVYGIHAGSYSVARGNACNTNGGNASGTIYGLYCWIGASAIGNTSTTNGSKAGGTGYGIHLQGNNLVDQNMVYGNTTVNMTSCATCTFGTNHAP